MMKGSSYLNSTPRRAVGRPRRFGSVAALLLVFAVLLSSFASTPVIDSILGKVKPNQAAASTSVINSASAIWCADPKEGNLGYGMDNRKDWKSGSAWYPHSDASSRVLTAQEAFSNGVRFVNFDGVGESPGMPWFWISPSVGLPEKSDNKDEKLKSVVNYTKNTPDADWYSKMNGSRTATNCVMGDAGTLVANGILGITNGITNLMGGISTFAFDPNFICEPNSGAKDCIDLVGIIGGSGKNSDSGIIGKLTSSVYFPLLALAALLVGIWIIINGLAKRQFRETFLGLLWSVIVTILGIGILLNPLLLAKAPMVVGNAVTSCIVGAFSGSGACVNNGSGGGNSKSDSTSAMCSASSSKGGFSNQAAITMASMSCELWKAFVLQPYAQGSFGAPLDELDTKKSGTVANKLIAKNPGFKKKPETFCVNTKVKGKLNSHFSNTLDLTSGGNKICNLAVYQAYLGVDAKVDGSDALSSSSAIDGRWLKVAQVAATDEGMYRAWAPTDWHLAQIGYASIGLISAFLAAIVIFVVAAFALAFYVTSLLMIAFAPFFLLAGVHPGKGRKMMTGWIGQVLSNIMKYIGSAIFLVIIVSIYGAVLANVTNPGAILIFMLILTVALLMYRREIIDMIGVIDLGGEKLSNKFAEKTMDRVKNTGKTAMAVGAGVTAGAISSGAMNPFNVSNWKPSNMAQNMGDTLRAGNDSFRRSIKSRPGMVGEVLKASDRISSDNRSDMATQARMASTEADRASKDKGNKQRALDTLNEDLTTNNAEANEQIEALGVKNSEAQKEQYNTERDLTRLESAENVALQAVTNPDFAAYQSLLNELRNLEIKATIAEESGNLEEAKDLRNQAMSVENEMRAAERRMTEEEFVTGNSQYNAALANALGDENVDPETAESYSNHVRRQYQDVMGALVSTQRRAEEIRAQQVATEEGLNASIVAATQELNEAELMESNTQQAADMAQQEVMDLRPGQTVRNTRVRRNARRIEKMQNFRPDSVADLTSALDQDNNSNFEENVVDETLPNNNGDNLDNKTENNKTEDTVSDTNAQTTTPQNNVNSLIEQNRFKLDHLNEVKSDVSATKSKVISDWQNADTEDPEGIARRAYVNSRIAQFQGAEAESRIAALQSKEREAGSLSEDEEHEYAAAEAQLKSHEDAFNNANRMMANVGTDAKTMDEKFNKEMLDEYSQTESGQRYTKIDNFERFEKQLGKEIGKVQTAISTDEQNQSNPLVNAPVDKSQANEQVNARPVNQSLPKLNEAESIKPQSPVVEAREEVDYSQSQSTQKVEPVVEQSAPPIGRNARDRQVDQTQTNEQDLPQTQKVERQIPVVEAREEADYSENQPSPKVETVVEQSAPPIGRNVRDHQVDQTQTNEQRQPQTQKVERQIPVVEQPAKVDYSQDQPSPKVEPVVEQSAPPIGRNVGDRQVDQAKTSEQALPQTQKVERQSPVVEQPVKADYSQNRPSPKVEPVVEQSAPPIGRNVRDGQVDQARTPEQRQPQTQKVERELPRVEDKPIEAQVEQPQKVQPVQEMKRDEAPRVQSRRAEAPTPAPKAETPRVAPVLDQKDIAAKEANLKSIQREFEQKEQEAKNLNEKADEIFRNNQAEEARLKANADEARNRAHSLNESSAGYDQAVERMNEKERHYRDSIQEMESSYRDAQDRIEEAEKAKHELMNEYMDTDKEIRASRKNNTVSANPTQRERTPKVTETPRATQNETKRVPNKENLDRIEGSSYQPSRSEMEKDLRQLDEKVRQARREAQEAENKARNMSAEADNLRSENKRKIVELESDLSDARSRDSYSSESKEALRAYYAAVEESEADIKAADQRLDEARRKSELLRSNVVANEDEYSIAKKRVQTARSVLDSDGPNFKDSESRSSKKKTAGDFSAKEMKAPGQEETLDSDMKKPQGKKIGKSSRQANADNDPKNNGDNPFRGNPFKRK